MNLKQTTKTILLFLAIHLIMANAQASAPEEKILVANRSGETLFCDITINVEASRGQIIDTQKKIITLHDGAYISAWKAPDNTVSHIIIKNHAGIEYYNEKKVRITKYGHPVVKIELIKHTKNGKRFIETEVLMDNILMSENRVNQLREEILADKTKDQEEKKALLADLKDVSDMHEDIKMAYAEQQSSRKKTGTTVIDDTGYELKDLGRRRRLPYCCTLS